MFLAGFEVLKGESLNFAGMLRHFFGQVVQTFRTTHRHSLGDLSLYCSPGPEDGGNIYLRNIHDLLLNYKELQAFHRHYNASLNTFFQHQTVVLRC